MEKEYYLIKLQLSFGLGVDVFDDGSGCLTMTNTHGLEAIAIAASLQLVHHLCHQYATLR